jgi:two-component system chemotaxis response regulator CheB
MSAPPEIIGIVSSTGGPAALVTIIQELPSDFPLPVVIVQHISPDFVDSLRSWIARTTSLTVTVAQPGERPLPGSVYLAPGGKHLRLNRYHRFELDENPSAVYHIPSGDVLLESIGQSYGKRAIGVVLTGIGDDGASGLRFMSDAGAFTLAQDEATSVVYGMPKAALALGGVRQVLSLPDIASALVRLSQNKESIP